MVADLVRIVLRANCEVAPQEVDDREIWRDCRVGASTFKQPNPANLIQTGKLPPQTRLPHPRIPDHTHHLAASPDGRVKARPQEADLLTPANEGCPLFGLTDRELVMTQHIVGCQARHQGRHRFEGETSPEEGRRCPARYYAPQSGGFHERVHNGCDLPPRSRVDLRSVVHVHHWNFTSMNDNP